MTNITPSSIHLTTEAEVPHRRAELAREVFGRQILRMDVLALPDHELEVDLRLHAMPGLRIGEGYANGASTPRTKSMLSDGNDDLFISMLSGGTILTEQRGRQVVLKAGSFHVTSNAEPVSFTHYENQAFALSVPRKAIAALVCDLDDRIAAPMPPRPQGLELLRGYVRTLTTSSLATFDASETAVTHVHDLIALIIGATRDGAEVVHGRGLKAARLMAIKAYVEKHLGSGSLSASGVATAHQITERYLQRLFEAEGTPFVTYVLNQRLLRAHRRLGDTASRAQTISAIAYESGFSDISHFNHMFRRRYGATPSDVRNDRIMVLDDPR